MLKMFISPKKYSIISKMLKKEEIDSLCLHYKTKLERHILVELSSPTKIQIKNYIFFKAIC